MRRVALAAAAVVFATTAAAQGPHTDEPAAVKALQAARFPQPVRVGTLIGWPVILPGGRYERVGVATGVFQPANDDPQLVLRYRGHLVALSLDQVALVGAMIKAVDTDRGDLDKLPMFRPANGTFLPADASIRIGVDKKY